MSQDGSSLHKPPLQVLLCSPRGFCAGVVRAIDTVERALALHGPPVYVRHEIVHNRYVVDSLRAKGAIFVEDLEEIPDTDSPGGVLGAWRPQVGARRGGAAPPVSRSMPPARW